MSVKAAGVDWTTLKHKIMLGGQQIGKIYVGDTLVYPDEEDYGILNYASWFSFNEPIISAYSPEPVDKYGVYLYADNIQDLKNLHRIAVFYDVSHDNAIYSRTLVASFKGQILGDILYVPFVAYKNNIIADGISSSKIATYSMNYFINSIIDGEYYYGYRTGPYVANLADASGRPLQNFYVTSGSSFMKFFMSSNGDVLEDAYMFIMS